MGKCCDMKGYLTFIVLKMISSGAMSGENIRQEIEKRKGHKPSPGTIYPVLKSLSENQLIEEVESGGKEKKYRLTLDGKRELRLAIKHFIATFCDMKEDFEKSR